MEMVNLALKTGFSFKRCYMHIEHLVEHENDNKCVGIADDNGSFGFYFLEKLLKEHPDTKPIYGVRLNVVRDGTEKVKPRGQFGPEYIFLAKNTKGIKEIYNLIKINFDNFYYRGQISYRDVCDLSKNVVVISEDPWDHVRIDFLAITQKISKRVISHWRGRVAFVAINTNWYEKESDHDVYELLVGPRNSETQTYPQHILTTEDWVDWQLHKDVLTEEELDESINNTHFIANGIYRYDLPRAPMIKALPGSSTLEFLCKVGARKKGINIKEGVYADRYNREMKLINEKGFQDYFIVVADMIKKAKKKMLVGPGRGSSGGSLVCFLTGITECIDPIEHELLFERFIDITRDDLPDIDIDFPDKHRQGVIKQLIKDYGEDHVKQIANISRMKPKSAIGEFAKGLRIPIKDTEELKGAIIEHSGGDARAAFCMEDTFQETDIGKAFIEKYPDMNCVRYIENHPSHTSVHAAGVIVCNDRIYYYVGVNARDNTAMVEKKGAEDLNLLKIDVLGLRTLSILEDCAKMLGMKHDMYYDLPFTNQPVYDLLNDGRVEGIFQFEGQALKMVTKRMHVTKFDDMIAITSLGRPGALRSGGTNRYVKYHSGEEEPIYFGDKHKEITEATYGIVIFQEQILDMCRKIGNMTWEDVNQLRRALSKSLGKEFFLKYKEKFVKGALENGYFDQDAEFLWGEIEHGGSYAFNKSHAAAYAVISYWTAYMKANYPREFVVANLRNSKDDDSALKILRDAVENNGLEYMAIDPDESEVDWSVNSKNVIVGGLTNIEGIGPKKANEIIKMRNGEKSWTPSIVGKLANPETKFDILWPCRHYFGDVYENPAKYGLTEAPSLMKEINGEGEYIFIGQIKSRDIHDLNDYVEVLKRGGNLFEEGQHVELKMRMEDDTDALTAVIGRYDFNKMDAQGIAESAKIDEDWFLIQGKAWGDGSYVRVITIIKLDKFDYGIKLNEH